MSFEPFEKRREQIKPAEKEQLSLEEAKEKITETDKFIKVLGDIIKENREKEERAHVILATYNRVGRGKLPTKISRPDLNLDIWQASPDIPPPKNGIKDFFKKIAGNLERQLMYTEKGPIVIFYGGSGENFNEAAETIDNLSSLTELLDKEKKPEFFLLTCRCKLEEKMKAILPLIQNKRLEGMIFGKEGDCGGFNDLQKIADSLLKETKKEELS
jgi:hypothetical protein